MAVTADTREVIGEATLGELEGALRGRLVLPTDPDYAMRGWCGTPEGCNWWITSLSRVDAGLA